MRHIQIFENWKDYAFKLDPSIKAKRDELEKKHASELSDLRSSSQRELMNNLYRSGFSGSNDWLSDLIEDSEFREDVISKFSEMGVVNMDQLGFLKQLKPTASELSEIIGATQEALEGAELIVSDPIILKQNGGDSSKLNSLISRLGSILRELRAM